MAGWIADIEDKACIIHHELQAAIELAKRTGLDPVALATPYFGMLAKLYRDDFALACLADHSDLVARFRWPGVLNHEPPMSLVTAAINKLHRSIQHIAKSMAGLVEQAVSWPEHLEPRLSGLAQGGLVVGIRLPRPGELNSQGLVAADGLSEGLYQAVRDAVLSLPEVPRLIESDTFSDSICARFPDPAIRDTLLVAAHRLAPSSGDLGISELVLSCPGKAEEAPVPLTRSSHDFLSLLLRKPSNNKLTTTDSFAGVVGEIDCDALRFGIRSAGQQRGIRCIYGEHDRAIVQESLGCSVRVSGSYEAAPNDQPRLVAVERIEILR
jgi:hypothetical protein